VEVVKVKGGIAVFLSEHSGNRSVLELIIEEGPLIAKSDHIFDTLLTFLLEQCGGGGLVQEVQYQCIAQTGCHPLFLQ